MKRLPFLLASLTCVLSLTVHGATADEKPTQSQPAKSPTQMNDTSQSKDALHITGSALSLTVENVANSSQFLREHFGFQEKMAADGFASLVREDTPLNIIFLQRGIEVLPENLRNQRASGVIVAFVVTDIEAQEARLKREGVAITLPLKTEPWGERLFQVADPNGIVYELVEWVTPDTK